MSTIRENVLDRMRALLAKTRENGCTKGEELAALAKARAMRDAYAVTDEELQLAKEEAAVLHAPLPEELRGALGIRNDDEDEDGAEIEADEDGDGDEEYAGVGLVEE